VVLMSAMPDILVGLRYALGAAWGGVVLSELVAGDTGLGALEIYGGQSFDVAQIMVGMVVLAVLGYAANRGFMALQRRLFPWIVANWAP
ncbi:MAG: ABC transporter permease subunit, partial [Rhodospirillales bacterium]|nr:ABC transporter permease subunit [Rhodospirillales bacterium]